MRRTAGTHTGGAKQEQAAKGSQHLITLRKGAPTQGIEDNIEPTATGESVDDRRQIMMVIVNRMVHALRLQKGMFRRRRRAINFGVAETCQLHGRQTHPACSPMNQDMFSRPAAAPTDIT